jgi:hypothetical protein
MFNELAPSTDLEVFKVIDPEPSKSEDPEETCRVLANAKEWPEERNSIDLSEFPMDSEPDVTKIGAESPDSRETDPPFKEPLLPAERITEPGSIRPLPDESKIVPVE